MDKNLNIPIRIDRKDPKKEELEWIFNFLKSVKANKVLQIGAGPATWALNQSLEPETHVVVEDEQNKIDQLKDINVITIKDWEYEKYGPFDIVYVDSSSGSGMEGLHRDLAIQYAQDFMHADTLVIIHDYDSRVGQQARKYCENNDYKLIAKSEIHKNYGVYSVPEFQNHDEDESDQEYISDYNDITVVTACDINHISLLECSLPTWVELKKLTCPIYVFANGIREDGHYDHDGIKKQTNIIKYDNVKIIPWDISGAETQREKMLSAFIFGVSGHVNTTYWLKLDSDTIATDQQLFIKKSHLEHDMVGQPWGYTRPASMVPRVDFWLYGLSKMDKLDEEFIGTESYRYVGDPNNPAKQKHKAKRVISYCRLTKTSLVKKINSLILSGRMPIPSEDTLIWRFCDRTKRPWIRFRYSQRGWQHSKRKIKQKSELALRRNKS